MANVVVKKVSVKRKRTSDSGYWLYDNGKSHWGIYLVKHGKHPIKTVKVIHNARTKLKLKWYKASQASRANKK